MIDLSRRHAWPEQIPVTEAGYHARVAPSRNLDTGYVNPLHWGDRADEVERRYKPVDYPHEIYRALQTGLNDDWAQWKHRPEVDVPLHEVHASQPFVTAHHLGRYLDNPDDETDHVTKSRAAGGHLVERAANYPFNRAPGFYVHRNRLITLDGHHRVAAALLRGQKSIKGIVWDADHEPLPDPVRNGWEDYDPGKEG